MSTYTSISKYEVTHKWVIQDFNEYIDFYMNIEESYNLFSSTFSLNETDKLQFQLVLKSNKTTSDSNNFFSLYLRWNNAAQMLRMKYQFYILDVNNVKKNIFISRKSLYRPGSWGWDKFYELSKLLEQAEELLPHNALTIGCDILVYNDPVNVSSIYKRNFKSLMQDQFQELLASEDGSDFIFEVEDYEIKVHKSILVARSPVFKAMFASEMIENAINRTTIKDVNPEIFKIMIKFIYTDKMIHNDLNENDLIELLAVADRYQLENLKEICGECLYKLININNAMKFLLLAERYNVEPLIIAVKDFVKINKKNILATVDSEYFVENGHHASIFLF